MHNKIKSYLAHPLIKGVNIDTPAALQKKHQIIKEKVFLKNIYIEWYSLIKSSLPDINGALLELGSGGGFIREHIPNIITSDILFSSEVDLDIVLDGCKLPFADETISGIVLVNVLHHLADSRQFFLETNRCIKKGGGIIMIEPWVTPWSRFIYKNLHQEPFEPEVVQWKFRSNGPLSSANNALPWIIFQRDRKLFEIEFPHFRITTIRCMMPFRYLVSGGVSARSLQPAWSYGLWCKLEKLLTPFMSQLGMFAYIVIEKV